MFNNKSLKLSFIPLFFSVLALAQSGKDSVYIYNQDQKMIENILFSPTFSNHNTLQSFGILQLDYKRETGGLRRAQEAYNISLPKFVAKGYNVLGKFRIAGSLEFNNSTEDSLANGQKNNLEDFTTFYPYANKSGRYKRQNYIVKTSLSYSALKGRLTPFVNLDYQKHQSSGTVDPRLSSNRFIFKAKPGINFSLRKHDLGIYGIIGKADEQVSLGYKNDVYKTSLLFPDRIHYMNYGYGNSVIKDTSSVYKYDNYKGFGIQYATSIQKWKIQASGEYQHFLNKNYNVAKTVQNFHTIAEFNLNTITSSVLLSKKSRTNDQQIAIDLNYNDGYDGNLKTSGSLNRVNYRVNSLFINGSYNLLWNKDKKTAKEIGFDFAYNQNEKQDLGQVVGLAYEQFQVGVNGRLYHHFDKESIFKFSVAPYYIVPLNTTLKYNPNSLTEFVRNVVFTDYYYYNSKILGSNFNVEYISSKLIKNQQFGLYFHLDYRNQLQSILRPDLNPTFVPNASRTTYRFGVNMYL
ncbi:MAG: hypothetical protein EOO47_15075 [Flavobacterium sp.]|nr:MAG: hypothetical protein EOO47_15075 [Flavobacterium sp.]